MTEAAPALLLAVGVDAAAAHAGLFDRAGKPVATTSQAFETLHPAPDQAVHRMAAIWDATAMAIRACLRLVPDAPARVAGLAFSATAALVLEHDGPPPLAGGADVFAVEDRRAEVEAAEVTAMQDPFVSFSGGVVTAATHLPRLLWLRRRSPATWARVIGVRDLCDELARRATGVNCVTPDCLATQWPWRQDGGWRQALLDRIGLDDLPALIAQACPSHAAGRLRPEVAATLGLPAGMPVAAGMIDAHAATLGVLGRGARVRLNETLVLIIGDAVSGVAFAREARAIAGVRGPYRDAVLPGCWLHVAELPDLGDAGEARVLRVRRMIAELNANGCAIARVALTGAVVNDPVLVRLCRDALGADLVLTQAAHATLHGTAMSAAVAAGLYPDRFIALDMMSSPQHRFAADPVSRRVHDAAYQRTIDTADSPVQVTNTKRRTARKRPSSSA